MDMPKRDDAVAPTRPRALPRLGMGCAHIGDLFFQVSEADAAATLVAAWEAGYRYFDTAPWYGHGLSEHRLGALLRQVPRADVFVTTKVGRVYDPAPRGEDARINWVGGLNFAVRYDYTADGFAASLEQSRLRLGQSSVDALVIHDLDRMYHGADFDRYRAQLMDSGLAWLHEAKAAGEIGMVGMGMNTLEEFAEFAPTIDVDFFLVAMPYTLLDQSSLAGPMQACADRGIGVVIGSPYASGVLADPSAPGATYNYQPVADEIRRKALDIEAVCRRFEVPIQAAALQFPLMHPAVRAIIPGAASAEQARSNHAFANHAIPAELWAALKGAGLVDRAAPTAS